jgi:threonine dehydratase
MADDYLERILRARVYDIAVETPLERASLLSKRLGMPLLLKREDEQPTFSFKVRGAYNRMCRLDAAERAAGVVAASAGNHAQGVALAARRLGTTACIVMPATTPAIKVDAVAALGATVVLHGDTYDEAEARAREVQRQEGRVFVHPYDDPEVIAGQGTVGVELARQHPDPVRAVFVPVGGGGLIAGIGAFLKRLRPEIRLIGVEPDDAASMTASLAAGRLVELESVGVFADGVAVKKVGAETFRLCRTFVDEMVTVGTDAICAAIKDVFEDTRTIMEPAGALSVAGAKAWAAVSQAAVGEAADGSLIAVTTGANMNFDRLRHVSERAEIGEEREAIYAVTIPEKPGALKAFCACVGTHSITEFNYRYRGPERARVFLGLTVAGRVEAAEMAERFRAAGFETTDLSDDETAKLHVRHMVGGAPEALSDEVLYRFEFPERPGALRRFLDRMSESWNISLFHYRNHGTDAGRVLIGMQVPARDRSELDRFLSDLGYSYRDETENPSYRLFLS